MSGFRPHSPDIKLTSGHQAHVRTSS
ncbi:hypothetical protein AVEN_16176-1, partial [Araneus ventricosus]